MPRSHWLSETLDEPTGETLGDLILHQSTRGLQLSFFAAGAAIVVAQIYDWQIAALWLGAHVVVDGLGQLWAGRRAEAIRAGRRLIQADIAVNGALFLVLPSIWCCVALLGWYSDHPYGQLIGLSTVVCGALFMAIDKTELKIFLILGLAPYAVTLAIFVIEATLPSGDIAVLIVAVTTILAVSSAAHRTAAAAAQLRDAKIAAETASRTKSEFLAAMGHEIRTPMNAVLGMAELLAREKISPTAREHVRTIRHSGQLLMSILNDLLDMSKIEAGKMQVERIAFSTASVLDQVQRLWTPRAEEKSLKLTITRDAALPDGAIGDPSRLQQILFNLVSNALKFTRQGEVRVHASARPREGGIELVFEITDTGIGMDDATQAKLFGAFFQGSASTSRDFGGTGLGLAISRRLAEAMNGTLTVRSELGRGSTFTLTLMTQAAHLAQPAPSFGDAPAVRGLKLLLAEDHKVNQKVILAFLAPFGHRITIAEDGEAAVASAASERFDVILMDVQMPRLNGIDATRAIRAGGGPNSATPIIGLSADAFEDQKRAGVEAGMNDYVTKPIDARALAGAIARAAAPRAADARAA